MDIGSVLKQLRLVKGCSQLEIAANLNISRTAYSAWESEKVDLTLSQIRKIASVYKIDPVALVKMFFEGIDANTNIFADQLHLKR